MEPPAESLLPTHEIQHGMGVPARLFGALCIGVDMGLPTLLLGSKTIRLHLGCTGVAQKQQWTLIGSKRDNERVLILSLLKQGSPLVALDTCKCGGHGFHSTLFPASLPQTIYIQQRSRERHARELRRTSPLC
jgi:hypothetical protein